MSWSELAEKVNEASGWGVDAGLYVYSTELTPRLASAEQTSDGGERTEDLADGWQLRFTVDAGGGSALITGDELDVQEVDAETVLSAVARHGFDASALTWEDIGMSLPKAAELRVAPDGGAFPSLEEGTLVLVAPDGTEYEDGADCAGGQVSITVNESQFDGASELLTFTVALQVPGVAGAPSGTHAVSTQMDCSLCASYEMEPLDADALDSLLEQALDGLQADIDAAEEADMDDDEDEDDDDDDDDDNDDTGDDDED